MVGHFCFNTKTIQIFQHFYNQYTGSMWLLVILKDWKCLYAFKLLKPTSLFKENKGIV